MLARRRLLRLAAGAVAAPAVARAARAQGAQATLRLHHFVPPLANAHTKFLVPWARKVEEESGKRIRIEIFPSMQLGGTPPQLYDQARDGVADIVWTLPGSTPGRFPRIEVFELPFVANKRAEPNARAVQEFYEKHLRDEFKEVHPICLWAHDGGLLHTVRAVRRAEDLKGLRLRAPTRLAAEALAKLGAKPVHMPIPQVPDALTQKAIDGCVMPWEVVPSVKVHELVKFHTEIPDSPTLYTATFVLAMNKSKYESLPPELKKAIDANSGIAAAARAGRMWDDQAVVVEEQVKSRGNTVTVLTPDETARWRRNTQPVIDNWLKQTKENGIDGGKLLDEARAVLAKHGKA
jgi:TRAP-type C4-dicarboxylate transport system substrate-binding protein